MPSSNTHLAQADDFTIFRDFSILKIITFSKLLPFPEIFPFLKIIPFLKLFPFYRQKALLYFIQGKKQRKTKNCVMFSSIRTLMFSVQL